MREIKFRAWDYHQILEKWYMRSWDEIKSNCMAYFSNPEKFGQNNPNKEPHIIMQFTGLKDKNGVDIYEGDILKGFFNGVNIGNLDRVIFENGKFKLKNTPMELIDVTYLLSKYQCEVIGNIHDHSELLK